MSDEKKTEQKLSPRARFVLALFKDVLVPIATAAIASYGIYHVELAKRAKDAAKEAARTELKTERERKKEAKAFAESFLAERVARWKALKAIDPPAGVPLQPIDDDAVAALKEAWAAEHENRMIDVEVDDDQMQNQDQEPSLPDPWAQVDAGDYLEDAAESVQMQVQMQEAR